MARGKREFTSGANVMGLSVYCAGRLDDAFVIIIEARGAKVMSGLFLPMLVFEAITEAAGD